MEGSQAGTDALLCSQPARQAGGQNQRRRRTHRSHPQPHPKPHPNMALAKTHRPPTPQRLCFPAATSSFTPASSSCWGATQTSWPWSWGEAPGPGAGPGAGPSSRHGACRKTGGGTAAGGWLRAGGPVAFAAGAFQAFLSRLDWQGSPLVIARPSPAATEAPAPDHQCHPLPPQTRRAQPRDRARGGPP